MWRKWKELKEKSLFWARKVRFRHKIGFENWWISCEYLNYELLCWWLLRQFPLFWRRFFVYKVHSYCITLQISQTHFSRSSPIYDIYSISVVEQNLHTYSVITSIKNNIIKKEMIVSHFWFNSLERKYPYNLKLRALYVISVTSL